MAVVIASNLRKELAGSLLLQRLAAAGPQAPLQPEFDALLSTVHGAIASGKPQHIAEKMVAGKMEKFYEEVCLLEQPFIKDQTVSISQLIAAKIGKLGENIAVRRFARFKVGDAGETIAITKPTEAKAG